MECEPQDVEQRPPLLRCALTDQNKDSPIALCLTGGALWGSVDYRRGEIQLLAETFSHLFEPSPWVVTVDDASQEAQALADVVQIAPLN